MVRDPEGTENVTLIYDDTVTTTEAITDLNNAIIENAYAYLGGRPGKNHICCHLYGFNDDSVLGCLGGEMHVCIVSGMPCIYTPEQISRMGTTQDRGRRSPMLEAPKYCGQKCGPGSGVKVPGHLV